MSLRTYSKAYGIGAKIGEHLAYGVVAWCVVWGLYGAILALRALARSVM